MQPRLAITSGEPAGIGPDLCVQLARVSIDAHLIVFADPQLLAQRAQQLGVNLNIVLLDTPDSPSDMHQPGVLHVFPIPLASPVTAGKLDVRNATYVLNMLEQAAMACLSGACHGLVTAPLHKGVINDAGIKFSGHTEFLADITHTPLPVMMLETEGLRVALVTTHLPLREVADAITVDRLTRIIEILHNDLVKKYGIPRPTIFVCGLNPHAGEGGHLGIFSPLNMEQADAFLAMYHDQGLPILKFKGFGQAINTTLGLPIIRTSVDHGTALSLAASGKADSNSFFLAINTALSLVQHQA
ncbi:MAG: 4-hydroxythreonine-4-phosphate dehydrogenase [Gammaproteobacteria bacterium SG8_15]|nr:MAG: 4-hydroxythreonine-4-phosphate dehydrogenase [Gammaproteobacteria bacterium SG8_15]